ncbi:hypothetical protein D3C71_1946200 [compost metagenome]
MSKAHRIRHGFAFQQRRDQRPVEGIASGDSIDRFNLETGYQFAVAVLTQPHATATKGDDHRCDTFIVQRLSGARGIIIVIDRNTGQALSFGFVWRNHIDSRQ